MYFFSEVYSRIQYKCLFFLEHYVFLCFMDSPCLCFPPEIIQIFGNVCRQLCFHGVQSRTFTTGSSSPQSVLDFSAPGEMSRVRASQLQGVGGWGVSFHFLPFFQLMWDFRWVSLIPAWKHLKIECNCLTNVLGLTWNFKHWVSLPVISYLKPSGWRKPEETGWKVRLYRALDRHKM